ncbi:hypothetical protein M9Y82_10985 [Leptospira weilii]|uniref:hypothetical protein n=1 Tax=Leptospira weilii TaxID=28184 RepID=UPI001FEE858C|nr:hypothetical protein [Leptospira weilii]MCL8267161.1 hypothetical protein [Leptospira weilii]
MLFKTQWKKFEQKIVFRFLLRPGHWVYSSYIENRVEAIEKATNDLSPKDDNISVFIIKDNESAEASANELDLITFFYAASARGDLNHLYYVDISSLSFQMLGLNIRHNPNTSPAIINSFYSDRHYEIYYMTKEKRRQVAQLIFEKIAVLPEQKPLCVKKDKLKQTKLSFHMREISKITNFESFAPWAKP